jgi:hypothetical protein
VGRFNYWEQKQQMKISLKKKLKQIKFRIGCLFICYKKVVSSPPGFCGVRLGLSHNGRHQLKTFENKVLRRIFEPRMENITRGPENCLVSSFILHCI